MFSLCCPAGCGGFYMLRLVTVNADIPVKVQYSAMITLAPVDLSDSSTKSMIDVTIWFQVNKTLELSSGVEKWIDSVSCVWVVSCIADVACVYEKDLTLCHNVYINHVIWKQKYIFASCEDQNDFPCLPWTLRIMSCYYHFRSVFTTVFSRVQTVCGPGNLISSSSQINNQWNLKVFQCLLAMANPLWGVHNGCELWDLCSFLSPTS